MSDGTLFGLVLIILLCTGFSCVVTSWIRSDIMAELKRLRELVGKE